MPQAVFSLILILAAFAGSAQAQDRVTLGVGRLFTNDVIGDGHDRWRTGAYVVSWMRGVDGTVSLPEGFGDLIEYRFASQVFAPDDLSTPSAGDRPYAGTLSLGIYSHFSRAGFDFATGAELVAVGPMTGLDAFQAGVHRQLGMTEPSAAVRTSQIPNAVYPTLAFEASRPLRIGLGGAGTPGMILRPFVQARVGDETYARVGADLMFGPNFSSGVLARDETTGIPYQTLDDVPQRGFSFLVGADTARVLSSAWLPSSGGYALMPMRNRARAGAHWQGDFVGVFYGATWLGPEFDAQSEGQVVGSLQIRFAF